MASKHPYSLHQVFLGLKSLPSAIPTLLIRNSVEGNKLGGRREKIPTEIEEEEIMTDEKKVNSEGGEDPDG